MSITEKIQGKLRMFERKILRMTCAKKGWSGRVQNANQPLKGDSRSIKSPRIRWLRHVMRMKDLDKRKRTMQWRPFEERRIGRPKSRWIDEVTGRSSKMGVSRWWKLAENRDSIESAQNHPKLWYRKNTRSYSPQ